VTPDGRPSTGAQAPTTCYLGTSQIMSKTTAESQNRCHVGDVTVSRIIELESVFPTEVMMVGVTPERIKSIGSGATFRTSHSSPAKRSVS